MTKEQRYGLLVTALEGGSNYWYLLGSDAIEIYKKYGTPDTPTVDRVFEAIYDGRYSIPIRDFEEANNDEAILGYINLTSMAAGEKIMQEKYPEHYNNIMQDNWDADTADIWFQLAVMGEITFG